MHQAAEVAGTAEVREAGLVAVADPPTQHQQLLLLLFIHKALKPEPVQLHLRISIRR